MKSKKQRNIPAAHLMFEGVGRIGDDIIAECEGGATAEFFAERRAERRKRRSVISGLSGVAACVACVALFVCIRFAPTRNKSSDDGFFGAGNDKSDMPVETESGFESETDAETLE